MVKIFHECPNSIFHRVQTLTSGDYALVHLLDENEEYRYNFYNAVDRGREVILDNSVIELGSAFSSHRFADWVEKLKPTWYIIPDALGDASTTLNSFFDFKRDYKGLPGKAIAVAQGSSISELINCFETFHNDDLVEMIAIPFRPPFYDKIGGHINNYHQIPQDYRYNQQLINWGMARTTIMDILTTYYSNGIFKKPIHLLGCSLPIEGRVYKIYDMPWLYSVDTSNPIIAGIEGLTYHESGLYDKSKTNINDVIDMQLDYRQLGDVVYNIMKFKEFWNK